MERKHEMSQFCFNFVLLGKTGSGKSATGNTILRREAFISKKSHKYVTQDVQKECSSVSGIPLTVYDTPGFCNTELSDEQIRQKCQNVLSSCESESEICSYLLVIRADRFTAEERRSVEQIEDLLGEDRLKKTWILFTRGDELEEDHQTIEKFISRTDDLSKLVQKYENRYHVFNNKIRGSDEQVKFLIGKVVQTCLQSLTHLHRKKEKTENSISSDRRIVLLGKTGFGKSATGNTILGEKRFESKRRTKSVTRESEAHTERVGDRNVTVIDTPGFFDTSVSHDEERGKNVNITNEELDTEIGRSIYLSSPGPHAFLVVLKIIDRFTEQEEEIIKKIEMLFGEEVAKYTIILFTYGDQLDEDEDVENLISDNESLRKLVEQCGGGYHVFNNKDKNNREQVSELLEKIDRMVEKNGGSCYSNEMFEEAARFKREEEERLKQEEEERKQREQKQREEEIETIKREIEARIKHETREEIENIKREIEARIKWETQEKMNRSQLEKKNTQPSGFSQFWRKYKKYIILGMCGVALVGTGLAIVAYTGGSVAIGAGAAVSKGGVVSFKGAALAFKGGAIVFGGSVPAVGGAAAATGGTVAVATGGSAAVGAFAATGGAAAAAAASGAVTAAAAGGAAGTVAAAAAGAVATAAAAAGGAVATGGAVAAAFGGSVAGSAVAVGCGAVVTGGPAAAIGSAVAVAGGAMCGYAVIGGAAQALKE